MVRVCVFGSSSAKTPAKYLDVAYELGELIADKGHICVNGGGNAGVMGAANRGARARGGQILGVIHERFCVDKSEDELIDNMIRVGGNDLNARKQGLLDNSDCILVMPGGVGTFDELWDCVGAKSLGMKGMTHKPVCVVNVDGFFDGSIMQLQRAQAEGLLYNTDLDAYFHTESSVSGALAWVTAVLDVASKGGAGGEEQRVFDRTAATTSD